MVLLEYLRVILFQSQELSWFIVIASALLLTATSRIALHFISCFIMKIGKRTRSPWIEISSELIGDLKSGVIFGSLFFFFSQALPTSPVANRAILIAFVCLIIFKVGRWGTDIIRHWREAAVRRRIAKDPSGATAIGLMYTSAQIAFVVVIVLIGLSQLGVNIQALLTGLGVGGLAVALAAQNILGDLLSSLSIVIDKPFVVGDFIIVGNELGSVEYIGLKTTRIRSLSGEQLIFSNKDLLESRIRNCQRMWERRIVHRFSVINSTPSEVIEQNPKWIRTATLQHKELRYDRCHFVGYKDSNPEFEFVFWVLSPDYLLYVDVQQKLLLEIHRKFANEKILMAHPTQSLFVETRPKMESSQAKAHDSLKAEKPEELNLPH